MSGRAGGSPDLSEKLKANWPQIYLRVWRKIGPLTVMWWRGPVVRNKVWLDFTEGGNSAAYAWFPQWPPVIAIDDANSAEGQYILLHEMREYNAMTLDRMPYEKAHIHANGHEQIARDNPGKVLVLINEETTRFLKAVASGKHPEAPPGWTS